MSVPHAKVRRFPTAEPIQGEATHLDAAIATFASHQLNVITRRQLEDLGATRNQISHRVAIGALKRLHRAVFLTSAEPPTFEQRAVAASLACGDGSFASHATAAHLWQLIEEPPGRIDVTVPIGRRPEPRHVVVHRSQFVGPAEWTARGPFRLARPMRTLLDLAAVVAEDLVAAAMDRALHRGLVVSTRLVAYLDRPELRAQPGVGSLRRIARDRLARGHGESILETKALTVLERFGLPRPVRQYRTTIAGRNVRFDLAYPSEMVAIELDGESPHRERWQSDHDRHNVTELSGWRVLRFTWKDVTERPLYVAMTVADALAIRPARWVADKQRRSS